MKIYEVKLHQEFDITVEELWGAFNHFDSCGDIMGQKMIRVKDSSEQNNVHGVGAIRKITIPLIPFEETILK